MAPDDLVDLRADLYRDLASVLVGCRTEAETAAATAIALYEKQGNLIGFAELIR